MKETVRNSKPVQQQQLINDTGADGVSYLDRALEFIIESMDLAHAECPAKSQEQQSEK